jgi:hypothetical protein
MRKVFNISDINKVNNIILLFWIVHDETVLPPSQTQTLTFNLNSTQQTLVYSNFKDTVCKRLHTHGPYLSKKQAKEHSQIKVTFISKGPPQLNRALQLRHQLPKLRRLSLPK